MARRAFIPTIPPPPGTPAPVTSTGGPPSAPRSVPPPPSGLGGGERLSSPPGSLGSGGAMDQISMAACAQLLDRLAAADEAVFIVQWVESVLGGRSRVDSSLAVRLLRAYREVGRLDRARELAATLPSSPSSWNPLDTARLAIERAIFATIDGRPDHADAELRQASRALQVAPRGAGLREQLDMHLTQAQLELRMNRPQQAAGALRLAEHVAERLEEGAWKVQVSMTLGHLSMRLAEPRTAAKHYATALARSPARGVAAMNAHGNMAISMGSVGRFDDARASAMAAIGIAGDIAAGWRHADAYDVLAIVEIASDRPNEAITAIDEALAVLGDLEQQTLRYQLAEHRTWALAVLGKGPLAKQWLTKTDKLRSELASVDAIDEQDLVATRARTLEACGQLREAIQIAQTHAERLPDAFVTGNLNLVLGRCALASSDPGLARIAVERAALSGDKHGWVFPDRQASAGLWAMALKSGDSRVVRFAEKILAVSTEVAPPSVASPTSRRSFPSLSEMAANQGQDAERMAEQHVEGAEALIYVTTPNGVNRIRRSELQKHCAGATLVVDTLAHALRVDDREVSLERRRALEPLVVQLLRRAKEGLSAEQILRAAGGPGPESADAEHRVRVLISRVRDLLGDPAAIERVRDAGEYGKTRYRLSGVVQFVLIEPLFTSQS